MGKFDVLFNDIITQTRASLPSNGGEHREYSSLTAWPQAELCLGGGDAALELGGSLHGNASFLCATTDQLVTVGSDWPEYTPAATLERFTALTQGIEPHRLANILHRNLEGWFPQADPPSA